MEISSCALIPFFFFFWKARISPQWLSEVRQLWPSVSWWDACKLIFNNRFPHCAWIAMWAHSNFVGPRVYACLEVTCHLQFWQNDQGLLHATAVTQGWTDTERESAKRVNSGWKKTLSPLQPGLELTTFPSKVWHSTNKLTQLQFTSNEKKTHTQKTHWLRKKGLIGNRGYPALTTTYCLLGRKSLEKLYDKSQYGAVECVKVLSP